MRDRALKAIDEYPVRAGRPDRTACAAMIEKPARTGFMSRQRAWGVPITVFVRTGKTVTILPSPNVHGCLLPVITDAFERHLPKEGADAWFAEGAHAPVLRQGVVDNPDEWEKVR